MTPFHDQIKKALVGPVAAILTKWGSSYRDLQGEVDIPRLCRIIQIEDVLWDAPNAKEWLNSPHQKLPDGKDDDSWVQLVLAGREGFVLHMAMEMSRRMAHTSL